MSGEEEMGTVALGREASGCEEKTRGKSVHVRV